MPEWALEPVSVLVPEQVAAKAPQRLAVFGFGVAPRRSGSIRQVELPEPCVQDL